MHFDTTSHRVWGEDEFPEEQDLPCRIPSGYRQAKRPDLKPCVLATLCVDRAVPRWGTPEAGKASDTTLQTTRLSESAPLLAR